MTSFLCLRFAKREGFWAFGGFFVWFGKKWGDPQTCPFEKGKRKPKITLLMTKWAENTVGLALLTSVMAKKGSLAQPVTLRDSLARAWFLLLLCSCGQEPELDFSWNLC